MDFNFTEEQTMLRDMVASYLADNYGFDARRAVVHAHKGHRPEVWTAFVQELGILGASFAEEHGGLGGGTVENLLVMTEFGKALVTEDYLGAVVAAGAVVRHSGWDRAGELAAGIVAGTTIPAFAYAEPQGRYNWADLKTTATKTGGGYELTGHKSVVIGGPHANYFIVTARSSGGQRDEAGVGLFLVDKAATGVLTRDYPTVDGQAASELYLENTPATLIADNALSLVQRVIDEATVASLAEACGVLEKLHELTLEYTRTRKQFGQPISQFQVLQHRMVDMFINLQQAVSMTYMATMKVQSDDARERGLAVSAAKVQVARALKFVGEQAIQLHGGMGMTEEMPVSHYFKRASILRTLFGGEDHHIVRYETLSFGKAA